MATSLLKSTFTSTSIPLPRPQTAMASINSPSTSASATVRNTNISLQQQKAQPLPQQVFPPSASPTGRSMLSTFVSSIGQALDFNAATLSGAIDVIVVSNRDKHQHDETNNRHDDDDIELLSTPFHVRFGKLQLLKSREKIVSVEVNGVPQPAFSMKLSSAGEAYFVLTTNDRTDNDSTDTTTQWNSPTASPSMSPTNTIHSSSQSPVPFGSQIHIPELQLDMSAPLTSPNSPRRQRTISSSTTTSKRATTCSPPLKSQPAPGQRQRQHTNVEETNTNQHVVIDMETLNTTTTSETKPSQGRSNSVTTRSADFDKLDIRDDDNVASAASALTDLRLKRDLSSASTTLNQQPLSARSISSLSPRHSSVSMSASTSASTTTTQESSPPPHQPLSPPGRNGAGVRRSLTADNLHSYHQQSSDSDSHSARSTTNLFSWRFGKQPSFHSVTSTDIHTTRSRSTQPPSPSSHTSSASASADQGSDTSQQQRKAGWMRSIFSMFGKSTSGQSQSQEGEVQPGSRRRAATVDYSMQSDIETGQRKRSSSLEDNSVTLNSKFDAKSSTTSAPSIDLQPSASTQEAAETLSALASGAAESSVDNKLATPTSFRLNPPDVDREHDYIALHLHINTGAQVAVHIEKTLHQSVETLSISNLADDGENEVKTTMSNSYHDHLNQSYDADTHLLRAGSPSPQAAPASTQPSLSSSHVTSEPFKGSTRMGGMDANDILGDKLLSRSSTQPGRLSSAGGGATGLGTSPSPLSSGSMNLQTLTGMQALKVTISQSPPPDAASVERSESESTTIQARPQQRQNVATGADLESILPVISSGPLLDAPLSMSLCADLLTHDSDHNTRVFSEHAISYEMFCSQPDLLYKPELVVLFQNKLYSGRVALPLLMSEIVFGQPLLLTQDTLLSLTSAQSKSRTAFNVINSYLPSSMPKGQPQRASTVTNTPSSSFHQRSSTTNISTDEPLPDDISTVSSYVSSGSSSDKQSWRDWLTRTKQPNNATRTTAEQQAPPQHQRSSTVPPSPLHPDDKEAASSSTAYEFPGTPTEDHSIITHKSTQPTLAISDRAHLPMQAKPASTAEYLQKRGDTAAADIETDAEIAMSSLPSTSSKATAGQERMYRKSLHPTSDMLKHLKLKPGRNTVTYIVNSTLQGIQKVTSCIYYWSCDTKIVVSDIDGTITKSDVLGNVLPFVGKDWSHAGIAKLYSKIAANGYEMLYLTSRAIGQSNLTRAYLQSLRQDGDLSLPDGPLILSPDRLLSSFKREVIDRKPQEFKIIALTAVRELFTPDHNCFYAGFGNRITDIIAYRAVGVPATKIFIVNGNSQIQHVNTLYTKSYPELAEMTDFMFPNRTVQAKRKVDNEFNTFNYWKQPIDLSLVEEDLEAQKQKQKAKQKNDNKSHTKKHVNGIRKTNSLKRQHSLSRSVTDEDDDEMDNRNITASDSDASSDTSDDDDYEYDDQIGLLIR